MSSKKVDKKVTCKTEFKAAPKARLNRSELNPAWSEKYIYYIDNTHNKTKRNKRRIEANYETVAKTKHRVTCESLGDRLLPPQGRSAAGGRRGSRVWPLGGHPPKSGHQRTAVRRRCPQLHLPRGGKPRGDQRPLRLHPQPKTGAA